MLLQYQKYLEFANQRQARDINKIHTLLSGEDLFAGLTDNPVLIDPNDEFTCISNVVHGIRLSCEQPESGYFKTLGSFCYADEVLGGIKGDMGNKFYNSSQKKYNELYRKMGTAKSFTHSGELRDIFKQRFEQLGLAKQWYARPELKKLPPKDRNWYCKEILENYFIASIRVLEDVAMFGGISNHEYADSIFNGYYLGGIPCGWLGPRNYPALFKLRPPTMLLHFGGE